MNGLMNAQQAATGLLRGQQLLPEILAVHCGGCTVNVRSNDAGLLAVLGAYFRDYQVPGGDASLEVIALQCAEPDPGVTWTDWKREPGKSGRKDSFCALDDGRLLRKVRTGMVFLQSAGPCIAAGDCLAHDNQVINFINSQAMNWLQQQGWLICHASGLVRGEHGLAIAGFSGGGKSTLMLRLMQDPHYRYLTNDRLFVRRDGDACQACGIAKLPRINPGTLVNDVLLQELLGESERKRLKALPLQELWQLEQKHDVPVGQIYGAGRLETGSTRLAQLFILNWQHDAETATRVLPVEFTARGELLAALLKSPGPFFQDSWGQFLQNGHEPDGQQHLQALSGVAVYEITGRIDFARAAEEIDRLQAGLS